MSFTPFIKPYPDGYEDGEIGNTPVTAAILNTNYDGFLLALNEFLPELEGMVEANPSESATAGNLTKLKVGNSIYLVPSGGSGGSTVEWEQIQLTGTRIATITIDNVPIDVYAPSGGGSGDEVSWNQVLGSGTEIGTITINGTPITVYAPTPIDVEANPSGSATAGDLTKLKVGSSIYSIPSGGSGGASDLSDLGDVTITNVQNGQILKWNSTTSKWENVNDTGGGSGHTIIDENGNSMTARAGLQFVGANVSDDATNNKTIVDISGGGGGFGLVQSGHTVYTLTGLNLEDRVSITFDTPFPEVPNVALSLSDPSRGQYYNPQTGLGVMNVTENGFDILIKSSSQAVAGDILIYWIATTKFSGNGIFHPIIYSTEEREIGVWTDGKPLYQKSYVGIDITVSYNSWGSSGITLSNVDTIVKAFGTATDGSFQGDIMALDDSGDLKLQTGRNVRDSNVDLLTIQYTKTTDVAGSGTWTPQGVPAVHYSTDEQIVGTWIDGKTLYEKTFYIHDRQFNSSGECDFDVTSLNSDILMADNMASYYTFSISSTEYTRQFEKLVPEEGHVYAYGPANRQIATGYITIRYTKSS